MNAIDLLKSHHRKIETLLSLFQQARSPGTMRRVIAALADQLVIYAALEELHLYPTIRARQAQDIPLDSLDDHRGIERMLSDLLETRPRDQTVSAKILGLKQQVDRHLNAEENDLFPRLEKRLGPEVLEALGAAMAAENTRFATTQNPWQSIFLHSADAAAG
jgi:hemerythrin superfamily protein